MFQGYQTVEEVINNFNPKAETVETATFGMGCFWGRNRCSEVFPAF